MYQAPYQSFSGRGRGYDNNGRSRGRGYNGRGRGRGRGGFHNNNNNRQFTEVDYSPEAIESRFAVFYLPSMTQDPWKHLLQQK